MALANCSACTKEVAVNARRCPHCGANWPAPGIGFSIMTVVVFLLLSPFLIGTVALAWRMIFD